ncbi:MAG: glycosyltransferase family 87 protein [Anaerolineaceae bacterium]
MKIKSSTLNFKGLNWKAILFFAIVLFYACLVVIWLQEKTSPIHYGGDYLAFWSTGKLADEQGFSAIHNVADLQTIQVQVLESLGFPRNGIEAVYIALPAPFFSIFMLPFKFLSRMDIQTSFLIWTIFNILVLVGYLAFFLREVSPKSGTRSRMLVLLLLLVSFPVFDNLVNGQLNVLLLLCCGEFIRNASKKNPFPAGLWLGGMLLKPQVLILILPVLLLQRHWKVIWGFIVASLAVVGISTLLSGIEGMTAYARLLTGWGQGNSVTAPEAMVNWRMIAAYANTSLGSPAGWIIAATGVLLTLTALVIVLRRRTQFGSPEWGAAMLAVMAATLAVTWHAHAHMAVVIIPLLLYAAANGMLNESKAVLWAALTPAAWLGFLLLGLVLQQAAKINILDFQGMVVAISGFAANLLILGFVYKNSRQRLPAGA